MDMKKTFFAVLFWLFAALWCFGQDDDAFSRGKDLFMRNKPQEAAACFENVVAGESAPVQAFMYLGMVYEQLDRPDEAIEIYQRVLDQAGDLRANVANNIGNVYFDKGSIDEAETWYTRAIEEDQGFPAAYLGRANVRLKKGDLQAAVGDYEQYLRLDTRAPQRADIERLTAYIRAEFAEAERKQRLKDEVSASLHSAADASQGLSSGAEDVEGYAGEFELE